MRGLFGLLYLAYGTVQSVDEVGHVHRKERLARTSKFEVILWQIYKSRWQVLCTLSFFQLSPMTISLFQPSNLTGSLES